MSEPVVFTIPVKTVSEMNRRDHWRAVAKRKKGHRQTAFLFAKGSGAREIKPPLLVILTRVAPRLLDSHDNLRSALKAVVDGIADALNIDDRDDRVTWEYWQEKALKRNEVRVEVRHD